MKIDIVVVAAGKGTRFAGDKIFYEVFGRPLIFYTLANLFRAHRFRKKILVLNESGIERAEKELVPNFPDLEIVKGGAERTHSVLNGVKRAESDYVLIHDGARPFVPQKVVKNVIRALVGWPAVTPAEPVRDTLKNFEGDFVFKSVPRSELKSIQTPQGFERELILETLEIAAEEGVVYTDETTLVEELKGIKTKFVAGSPLNFKVTFREDMELVERILMKNLRVGFGFDIHRFEEGRKMVLGGVELPLPYGLKGHSDGDAVTHAVIDALLGASGLGDIGEWFPDTDEKYKDIKSTILLEKVIEEMTGKGFYPVNLDIVVVTEKPKIVKFKEEIVKNLGKILKMPSSKISLKGKTAEKMGFVGREEGLAVMATTLVMEVGNETS